MSAPLYVAQVGAPATPTPSLLPEVGSPITVMIAIAFGAWLITKRKDSQAHEIIVTSRSEAREREKTDGEQIRLLMTEQAAMRRTLDSAVAAQAAAQIEQAAANRRQEEATKIQVEQAGKIGALESSVGRLERMLAEANSEVASLRTKLADAEARCAVAVAGRKDVEAHRDAIAEKLKVAEMRLEALIASRDEDADETEAEREFGAAVEAQLIKPESLNP